jgi:hypothetical protein
MPNKILLHVQQIKFCILMGISAKKENTRLRDIIQKPAINVD